MDISVSKSINTVTEVNVGSQPNKKLGLVLSFVCLILLGIMPIISNSRPMILNAADYTFFSLFGRLFLLFLCFH